MSRQTPTSRRSPSILVTDVRHQKAHSAPFVSRSLNNVSIDSLLSNVSEVPSAQRRLSPKRTTRSSQRSQVSSGGLPIAIQTSSETNDRTPLLKNRKEPPVKPVPRLSKPLPSRQSKQSQRLVLIPDPKEPATEEVNNTTDDGDSQRVTSYMISEGILLTKAASFLKKWHRARVRLYGDVLFADYLLPFVPGDGVDYRIQSSIGDNRTMERLIDISEQGDHHFEYFTAENGEEQDPSEPHDFSPRPGNSMPKQHSQQPIEEPEQVNEEVETQRRLQSYLSHAEIFIFSYGVVVFWNFTEAQEKQVLADLCIGHQQLVVKPAKDQDIQSEELRFRYTQDPSVKPKVFNDLITLNDNSHMLKLAMSHAMAQSTILCCFEDRMQEHLHEVTGVPKRLALTGKLGMNREQLLKISGRLFKLRVDVNLSSNVLEVPDFFWDSEPSLFPLFNALREYLEIDQRVLVLNERGSVFLDLTSILSDSIAEFNMDRITIIVIWLIVLSICVSLTEIAVRYFNVRRGV